MTYLAAVLIGAAVGLTAAAILALARRRHR